MTPTYYDVNHFHKLNFPVLLLLHSGREIVAYRKRVTRTSGRQATVWVEKRWNTVYHKYESVDVPKRENPTRWRPYKLAEYRDPLPPPAHIMQAPQWQSPPPEVAHPEAHDPLEWKGDYNEPGRISREEARIRVLRGLRTERSKKTIVRGANGFRLGEGSLSNVAKVEIRARGRIEYEHQDLTHIPNVGELWEPTRRDHGDWSVAVSWFNKLTRSKAQPFQQVVRERSFEPPSSFRQIGEGLGVGKSKAYDLYEKAIDMVTWIANTK